MNIDLYKLNFKHLYKTKKTTQSKATQAKRKARARARAPAQTNKAQQHRTARAQPHSKTCSPR